MWPYFQHVNLGLFDRQMSFPAPLDGFMKLDAGKDFYHPRSMVLLTCLREWQNTIFAAVRRTLVIVQHPGLIKQ